MNILEMYKNLTEEEKKEFVNLIFDEINKKADKSTFLEQYHNSLKAIADKPLRIEPLSINYTPSIRELKLELLLFLIRKLKNDSAISETELSLYKLLINVD